MAKLQKFWDSGEPPPLMLGKIPKKCLFFDKPPIHLCNVSCFFCFVRGVSTPACSLPPTFPRLFFLKFTINRTKLKFHGFFKAKSCKQSITELCSCILPNTDSVTFKPYYFKLLCVCLYTHDMQCIYIYVYEFHAPDRERWSLCVP